MIKGRAALRPFDKLRMRRGSGCSLLLVALGLSLLGFSPVLKFLLLPTPPASADVYLPIITTPSFDEQLLDLINVERRGLDLGSLRTNGTLMQVAEAHSQDMIERDFFGHVNPDGDRVGERVDAAGYEWTSLGEVIAGGYTSPLDALTGWLKSPSHKKILLDPAYVEIGTGYAFGPHAEFAHYWCVVVAVPND